MADLVSDHQLLVGDLLVWFYVYASEFDAEVVAFVVFLHQSDFVGSHYLVFVVLSAVRCYLVLD